MFAPHPRHAPHPPLPTASSPWAWDAPAHCYPSLGDAFVAPTEPSPLPSPCWVAHSETAAQLLGLPTAWHSDGLLQGLSGNAVLEGSQPYATVYSGHQFGMWAGQLGDGRALLLGQTQGWEVQLKGAGMTPFSRMGDGRAVLRSSIREFLASEAMHALGVPTTRALCITASPQLVRREEAEPAAVVTRLAPSFVRFGHFEHFSASGQIDALRALADWVIEHHYPACASQPSRYAALLANVVERSAQLVAHWQALGFCHGVLNTDNMSILGLTLDYGPFQFMDGFDPQHICNHSDERGRYAFGNQPNIVYWNLLCLGQALLALLAQECSEQGHSDANKAATDAALAAIDKFKPAWAQAWQIQLCAKLGRAPSPAAQAVAEKALPLLAAERVDYTLFWRRLARWAAGLAPRDSVQDLFLDRTGIDAWLLSFSELDQLTGCALQPDLILNSNPCLVLRNYMAQEAISAAEQGDYSVVQQLHQALNTPYADIGPDAPAHLQRWAGFPPDWAQHLHLSCSS
ncbi:YdiU family protein [Curvibacter sp. CHRR-16]|uniref:protein adenylyltransferase SelO n=1 Tax=Curvibacter sp. CHRR-16 TaxID=2835872 RepID=UPI001BD9A1DE|nr:YdiU family protein [Curvibacter sp. CHRR-16]MBT0571541.1 YdiU family protein [Curvibacter sp. CHRR-16]